MIIRSNTFIYLQRAINLHNLCGYLLLHYITKPRHPIWFFSISCVARITGNGHEGNKFINAVPIEFRVCIFCLSANVIEQHHSAYMYTFY